MTSKNINMPRYFFFQINIYAEIFFQINGLYFLSLGRKKSVFKIRILHLLCGNALFEN